MKNNSQEISPTSWQQLGSLLASPSMMRLWLLVIVLVGASFRFTGLDWDEGHHLHPDERFLSSVVNDIILG